MSYVTPWAFWPIATPFLGFCVGYVLLPTMNNLVAPLFGWGPFELKPQLVPFLHFAASTLVLAIVTWFIFRAPNRSLHWRLSLFLFHVGFLIGMITSVSMGGTLPWT